ncbi:MAG: GpE family phage tail protein [Hafnia sp.]
MKKATALLARWFRWQPSEIDALPISEFEDYLDEASEQIKNEYGRR